MLTIENFKILLNKIESGEEIEISKIAPYLALDSKENRVFINAQLALAYLKVGDYEQASIFIKRAWLFSDFSDEILEIYIKIHVELKDYEAVRKAYKRIGKRKSKEGNFDEALYYFQRSQTATASLTKTDKYEYDFEVLDEIEKITCKFQYTDFFSNYSCFNRKIRVAYIVFGMTHINSAIVRLVYNVVKNHNKNFFDVVIFSPDEKEQTQRLPNGFSYVELFNSVGFDVVFPSSGQSVVARLHDIAKAIYDFHADIVVFSSVLADLRHYYIATLKPAPILVGQLSGPVAQFAAPILDATISWSKAQAIESPCYNFFVKGEVESSFVNGYERSEFDLPEDAIILEMIGRHTKFQDYNIWKSLVNILHRTKNVFIIAIGLKGNEPVFFSELIDEQIREKVIVLSYRKDYLRIMKLADIIIDTYPSGGGQIIFDSMSLKKPIVSFEHDYTKPFDQATSWSVMGEYALYDGFNQELRELVLPRSNFDLFEKKLMKLVEDQKFRKACGEAAYEFFQANFSKPERMTENCEQIYMELYKKMQSEKVFKSGKS